MSGSKAAGRYAKALIDLSGEQNVLEAVKNDLLAFGATIKAHGELDNVLKNPVVFLEKKTGILEGLYKDKVNPITLSFFKLLVNKGRAALLGDIAGQFIEQYNQLNGIVKAEVIVASPLSDTDKNEVIALIKRELKAKQVELTEKVDEKLIGGLILKVGDKQFDGSIIGCLNRLRKELIGAAAKKVYNN